MQIIRGAKMQVLNPAVLFFMGALLFFLGGAYLYVKRDDSEAKQFSDIAKELRGHVTEIESRMLTFEGRVDSSDADLEDLAHRVGIVEVDIVEVTKPQTVNLVMKQPLKVLVKQVATAPRIMSQWTTVPEVKTTLTTNQPSTLPPVPRTIPRGKTLPGMDKVKRQMKALDQ